MRFIIDGKSAVIFFFVLSGFVLAGKLEQQGLTYFSYAKQRIARIYLPYLVATFFSFAIGCTISKMQLISAHQPFWDVWDHTNVSILLSAIVFILPFHINALNPATWSLVYEMRISLILPIIMLLIKKVGFTTMLLICLFFTLVMEIHGISLTEMRYDVAWLLTLHYIFPFVIGASLSYVRLRIVPNSRHSMSGFLIFFIGTILYANARLLKAVYLPAYGEFGMDWIACVGSGLIILGVLKEPRIEHALEAPLLLWLGKISYSFYLYHLLVIILIFRIIVTYKLNGPIVDVAAALMSFLCSLALAVASEYWIERPSRRLGARFGANRRAVSSTTA